MKKNLLIGLTGVILIAIVSILAVLGAGSGSLFKGSIDQLIGGNPIGTDEELKVTLVTPPDNTNFPSNTKSIHFEWTQNPKAQDYALTVLNPDVAWEYVILYDGTNPYVDIPVSDLPKNYKSYDWQVSNYSEDDSAYSEKFRFTYEQPTIDETATLISYGTNKNSYQVGSDDVLFSAQPSKEGYYLSINIWSDSARTKHVITVADNVLTKSNFINSFVWSFKDNIGKTVPEGTYYYSVELRKTAGGAYTDLKSGSFKVAYGPYYQPSTAGTQTTTTSSQPASSAQKTTSTTNDSDFCAGYKDMYKGDMYCEAVQYVTDAGIFSGTNSMFKGSSPIQRAETGKVIVLAFGLTSKFQNNLTFSDTDNNAWYASYLRTLIEKGVIKGYTDNTFKPANAVTRAEFLKMALEGANITTTECRGAPYKDVSTSDWYCKYFQYAKSTQLLENIEIENGSGTLVSPNREMQRQEAAMLLYQMSKANLF